MRRALLATAVLALSVQSALAAPCGQHEKIAEYLRDKHDEEPRVMGLTANGWLMEIWAADTGTWTLLIIKPGGEACVRGSGKHFDILGAFAGRES